MLKRCSFSACSLCDVTHQIVWSCCNDFWPLRNITTSCYFDHKRGTSSGRSEITTLKVCYLLNQIQEKNVLLILICAWEQKKCSQNIQDFTVICCSFSPIVIRIIISMITVIYLYKCMDSVCANRCESDFAAKLYGSFWSSRYMSCTVSAFSS
jgi:hypothetical protein